MPLRMNWWEYELGSNSLQVYGLVALAILAVLVLGRFLSRIFSRILYRILRRKSGLQALKTFENLLVRPLEWLITLVVVYIALTRLNVPQAWDLAPPDQPGLLLGLRKVYSLTLIGAFTFFAIRLVDFFTIEFLERSTQTDGRPFDKQLFPFVRELLKIFLVIIAFFFGLGFVFELNVANLVAGLGLGGLAFALAAKESLENLFASFTIFLDKPFVVGDLVTVNNITGHIEKVGFRSTRIRTLDRSFLTLPNKFMTDHSLDNLTLRTHRRSDSILSLEYQTPPESLQQFAAGIRQVLEQHPSVDPEFVVRFTEFGESGFHIRILYFAATPEFEDFQEVKEAINLAILHLAHRLGIAFAYPSRTLFLRGQSLPGSPGPKEA